VTIDGYGSPDLSADFIGKLTSSGVRLHIFDPHPRFLGLRTNMFRRLHRKIVSIDGNVAFIGGINFSADHLESAELLAKQDYAVRLTGSIAEEIHDFARRQVAAFHRQPHWWLKRREARRERRLSRLRQSNVHASLVTRDNDEHRDDIERMYRAAIRSARNEIVIACAYFFPGFRLLKQLRGAARRGVTVSLILQGAPDVPQARAWARLLYPSLLEAGVEIYEYCRHALHAKIAVIDDEWCTVGSSNLDPLSLSLNLEANVVIRDRIFNHEVRERLDILLQQHCRRVDKNAIPRSSSWLMLSNFAAYHCTRHFPRWAGWLPSRLPKLHSVEQPPLHGWSRELGMSGDRCRD